MSFPFFVSALISFIICHFFCKDHSWIWLNLLLEITCLIVNCLICLQSAVFRPKYPSPVFPKMAAEGFCSFALITEKFPVNMQHFTLIVDELSFWLKVIIRFSVCFERGCSFCPFWTFYSRLLLNLQREINEIIKRILLLPTQLALMLAFYITISIYHNLRNTFMFSSD